MFEYEMNTIVSDTPFFSKILSTLCEDDDQNIFSLTKLKKKQIESTSLGEKSVVATQNLYKLFEHPLSCWDKSVENDVL